MTILNYIIYWWKKNIHIFLTQTSLFAVFFFFLGIFFSRRPLFPDPPADYALISLFSMLLMETFIFGFLSFLPPPHAKKDNKYFLTPPIFALLLGMHLGDAIIFFKSFTTLGEQLFWATTPLITSFLAVTTGHVTAELIKQKMGGDNNDKPKPS